MPTDLFDLAAKITVDAKGVDKTLTDTQKKVIQLADQFKKAETTASTANKKIATSATQAGTAIKQDLGGAVQQVAPQISALAGAGGPITMAVGAMVAMTTAAAAAAYGLFQFATSASESAGKIYDMQQQLNLSAETLSGLDLLAKQSGTTIEQLSAGIGIFDKKVASADATIKKFKITTTDTEVALRQALKALGAIDDPTKQVAASMELFGRSGKSMLGVLKQADGDIDQAIARFKQMGAVLDEDAIAKADEFNDRLVEVSAQVDTLKTRIGMSLLPAITTAMNDVSDLLEKNQTQVAAWARFIAGAAQTAILPLRVGLLPVLRDITAALEYLASRRWSITYSIVQIGGVPVPIPSGVTGTPDAFYGIQGGMSGAGPRAREMGGGGAGGGGGRSRSPQVEHWKALHDAIKKAVGELRKWRELVPSGWKGEDSDPIAGAAAKAAEVAAQKWERLHQAIDAAVDSIKGWKEVQPAGWTQGAPTITDKIGEAGGAVADIVNEQTRQRMEEQLQKARETAQGLTNIISNSIHAGFREGIKAGAITFAQGILQMIEMKALDRLASAITDAIMKGFGGVSAGKSGGGSIFGQIGGLLISGLLGGLGGGAKLPVKSTPWNLIPGIPKFASGTDFVPHDMLAVVHQGEKITPASQNRRGGGDLHVHFHVDSVEKAGSRETQRQLADKVRRLQLHSALTG